MNPLQLETSPAVRTVVRFLPLLCCSLLPFSLLAGDRIQFSVAPTLPTNVNVLPPERPSFDALNKESSVSGIMQGGSTTPNSGLNRSSLRVYHLLNQKRLANEKDSGRLPTIEDMLGPRASRDLRMPAATDTPLPDSETHREGVTPGRSPGKDSILESDAFATPGREEFKAGYSLQFNTLVDGGSDRPVLAVPPPRTLSMPNPTAGPIDAFNVKEKEKEKEKNRLDGFKGLFQTTTATPRRINPGDPVNLAVDTTLEQFNPITPIAPRSLLDPRDKQDEAVAAVPSSRSKLFQDLDFRPPTAPAATGGAFKNEPPRPRPTASFLPIPKRAF